MKKVLGDRHVLAICRVCATSSPIRRADLPSPPARGTMETTTRWRGGRSQKPRTTQPLFPQTRLGTRLRPCPRPGPRARNKTYPLRPDSRAHFGLGDGPTSALGPWGVGIADPP